MSFKKNYVNDRHRKFVNAIGAAALYFFTWQEPIKIIQLRQKYFKYRYRYNLN